MKPKNDQEDTFYAKDREEWRRWLEDNHDSYRGIWLVIFKKGSGKPHITYEEAVEEGLCFGWIDNKPNVIDEERFKLRFTPRKPRSAWSRSNKKRVEKLIEQGLMTPAGMRKIEEAKRNGAWDLLEDVEDLRVPEDLEKALAANPPADVNFKAFSDSAKKQILFWIKTAKLPETRRKRVEETARLATENKRANQYVRKNR
jgi:uncharacterized protein YdeI (YjbR/CyaY-like superfamily)